MNATLTLHAMKEEPIAVPFETDGCSAGISEMWRATFNSEPPFEGCCVDHDRAYWQGGPAWKRRHADEKLRECVMKRGHPAIAWVIYLGVRIFGAPYWPHRKRWGYSRQYRLGYPQ
jgi:hypothetical protein